jgi:CheY-like chemotaxis protein
MCGCLTTLVVQFKPKQKQHFIIKFHFFPSCCYKDDILDVGSQLKSRNIHTSPIYSNNIINEKKRIMIVDDERDIACLYKLSLEQDGFFVDVYSDPLVALANYKTGVYDLLLVDIKMPGLNGFKLYQEIVSRHLDNKVKICFITAFEEYLDEFKELFPSLDEVDCFIRKPIALKALSEKVKSRLQQ